MIDDSDPVASAAARWLAVGRDVLIRGDIGSGKTYLLTGIGELLARRIGYRVIMLRARRRPTTFGPLIAHPSFPSTDRRLDERTLVAWLDGELQGRRNVLLLDDLDRFDAGTLSVVWTVLQGGGTSLVTTLADAPSGTLGPLATDLLAERAPARLRTRALGLSATAALLEQVLGGPATASLVASVSTRSAGNARVAIAVADAARFAEAVASVDGTWTKVGSIDAAPMEPVAHALLTRLPREEVEALTALAWSGPVDADEAARTVDAHVLTSLTVRGRVVAHELGAGRSLVAVSPPALGAALRARTSRHRHHTGAAPTAPTPLALRPADGWDLYVTDSTEDDEYWRWSAELAGLVHDRAAAAEARARTAWQLEPTVAHAGALLTLLMRRVAPAEVEAVLAGTEPAPTDTPQDRALLRALEDRWSVWRQDETPQRRSESEAARAQADPTHALRVGLLRASVEGASDAELLGLPGPAAEDVPVVGWEQVLRAGRLLEAGRADLALTVCETTELPSASGSILHYLEGVHGLALLLLGQLQEAEHLARTALDRAVADLDGTGIRVHACVLAEVLTQAQEFDSAWRVLSTALRLGPVGPVENTFYRRSLTLGTVLRARAQDVTLAQALYADLAATPPGYQPLLRSMRVLAASALGDAGGPAPDAEQLWERGRGYARQGLMLPALLCWLFHPGPLGPVRVRQVRAAFDRARLPLLEPLLRVHEAVVEADHASLDASLDAAQPQVPEGLRRTAVAMLAGSAVPQPRQAPRALSADGPLATATLTQREREIAQCVRDGLSNRDIADEFSLSTRTVENHVSRALKKLGFSSRRDLARHLEV
ncbi:MAG TPA: helix-turn-helix transcriptional regulator [Cellulomonas sp.]